MCHKRHVIQMRQWLEAPTRTSSYLAQMWQELPPLRDISLSKVSSLSELPKAQIKTDEDLEHWKSMQSYRDYILFLRRLNESVVGTSLPWNPEHHSQVLLVHIFGSHISITKKVGRQITYSPRYSWTMDHRDPASSIASALWELSFQNMGRTVGEGQISCYHLLMHIKGHIVVEVWWHPWVSVGAWIYCGDTVRKTLLFVFVRVIHSNGLWNWSRNFFRFISVLFDACPILATWAQRRTRYSFVYIPALFETLLETSRHL